MKPLKFFAKVVYGFRSKLEIVILGDLISGNVQSGMVVEVILRRGTKIGNWEIKEVLNTDFINQYESNNFLGLVLNCADESDFELLKSLRIYDECILIKQSKVK